MRRFIMLLLLAGTLAVPGCIESQTPASHAPFAIDELDAVLAIVVDTSGSFATDWEGEAYQLFLRIMEEYFSQSLGSECRIVLCQLSGNDQTVLFEGRPEELRARFASPTALSDFLRQHSDAGTSPVYEATARAIAYVNSLEGVTADTRLLTVVLSDLIDTQAAGAARNAAGQRLLKELTRYRESQGALALYCVAEWETERWRQILARCGFVPGRYVIENTLTASPQLPTFE